MASTPTPAERTAVLDAGLHWLFETEQPDNAWAQHHGATIPATGNRTYYFVPAGARQRPVIVVNVARIEWIDNGPNDLPTPANPLEPGELEELAAELERRGFTVDSTWNGHPSVTGSVGLARPAHPLLLAAVERYLAGCTEHPQRGVFCDCDGWRAGFRRLVMAAARAEDGAR